MCWGGVDANGYCTTTSNNSECGKTNYATCIRYLRENSDTTVCPSDVDKSTVMMKASSTTYKRNCLAFNWDNNDNFKGYAQDYCAALFAEADSTFDTSASPFCGQTDIKKCTIAFSGGTTKYVCVLNQEKLNAPETTCSTPTWSEAYLKSVFQNYYNKTVNTISCS